MSFCDRKLLIQVPYSISGLWPTKVLVRDTVEILILWWSPATMMLSLVNVDLPILIGQYKFKNLDWGLSWPFQHSWAMSFFCRKLLKTHWFQSETGWCLAGFLGFFMNFILSFRVQGKIKHSDTPEAQAMYFKLKWKSNRTHIYLPWLKLQDLCIWNHEPLIQSNP